MVADATNIYNPLDFNSQISTSIKCIWNYSIFPTGGVTNSFIKELYPQMKSLVRVVTNAHYLAVDEINNNRPRFGVGLALRYPLKFRITGESNLSSQLYLPSIPHVDCECISPFADGLNYTYAASRKALFKCTTGIANSGTSYMTISFGESEIADAEYGLDDE